MLTLNTQNRVDLLFAHITRKDADSLRQPAEISDFIFEQISPRGESLYLKDVQERVQILCDRWSSSEPAPEKNKGGRPQKWHGRVRQIRVPEEFADALVEIALEWQSTKFQKQDMPF